MKYPLKVLTLGYFGTAILAILNFRAVMSSKLEDRPKLWLQIFAWIWLLFLIFFSVYFLIWRFF